MVHLSVALEECVSLLVEDDDDVSRLKARLLVSLPREGHLLPILHPLVHGHLQDLSLAVHFTPVALLAPKMICWLLLLDVETVMDTLFLLLIMVISPLLICVRKMCSGKKRKKYL